MSKLAVDWTKGLTPEQKEQIESLTANSLVLQRMKALIKEYEQQVLDQETSLDDYDSPSWSHKQADRNGYRRGLRKVMTLLNHLK